MKKLDVQHFLGIYQIRKRMQDEGVTNPSDEVKKFTKNFVEKLSNMPFEEEVKIIGKSFVDSNGNIIAHLPIFQMKYTRLNIQNTGKQLKFLFF